jgi:hypothetical protein
VESIVNDQWAWWAAASTGEAPPVRDGTPYSGYYRHRWNDKRPLDASEIKVGGARTASQIMWEAVGIWRDDDGKLVCQRGFPKGTLNIRGDLAKSPMNGGLTMTPEQIDELWSACRLYPISFELFESVMYDGGQWPDEILNDKGSLKAPGSVPGHNNPPETIEAVEVEEIVEADDLTPDELAKRKLAAINKAAAEYLALIGGKVQTEAQSHVMANYAIAARDLAKDSDKNREKEKKPHLDACRTVDSKWKVIVDEAKAVQARIITPVDVWQKAERARREAEAQAEADRLRAELEAEAERNPGIEVPLEIEPPKVAPIKSGTVGRAIGQRSNKVAVFTDERAAFLYVLDNVNDPQAPFRQEMRRVVDRLLRNGVNVPGASLKDETKAA